MKSECTCKKVRKDGLTYICPDCHQWTKSEFKDIKKKDITPKESK